jgi:hypothetical protein
MGAGLLIAPPELGVWVGGPSEGLALAALVEGLGTLLGLLLPALPYAATLAAEC